MIRNPCPRFKQKNPSLEISLTVDWQDWGTGRNVDDFEALLCQMGIGRRWNEQPCHLEASETILFVWLQKSDYMQLQENMLQAAPRLPSPPRRLLTFGLPDLGSWAAGFTDFEVVGNPMPATVDCICVEMCAAWIMLSSGLNQDHHVRNAWCQDVFWLFVWVWALLLLLQSRWNETCSAARLYVI